MTFDNHSSDIYTVIEVDTRDRVGLLYDLTRALASANISIPWEALVRLVTVGANMDTVLMEPAAPEDEYVREVELQRHFDILPNDAQL